MPGVFISHNHQDMTFVRRLGSDLAAEGARVWIDEAEINVGDSLIGKISQAVDSMEYFAIVLSSRSVASSWVQQELEQVLTAQLASRQIKTLPLLLEACEIPPFLRGKMYADFTAPRSYDKGLAQILKAIGLKDGRGGLLFDPLAEQYGRHKYLYSRPVSWHCIFCGWKYDEGFNDYICKSCRQLRPFVGGSATMVECSRCKQLSLAVARYCEWCGERRKNTDMLS